jgi:glycosyltransferase involved in cell wall biosynthesis
MHHGLPIVAYNSSAIRETLGNSGLVIRSNDPVTTAVAMNEITSNITLREVLKIEMTKRLEQLGLEKSRTKLLSALSELEPSLAQVVNV